MTWAVGGSYLQNGQIFKPKGTRGNPHLFIQRYLQCFQPFLSMLMPYEKGTFSAGIHDWKLRF